MTSFYTYFYTRNDTGTVFYVGKGKGKRAHSTGHGVHCNRIIAKHGHTVHTAMTGLSEIEAFEHEKFLIACFRNMGVPLCNMTDGGEGTSGWHHTEETKSKLRTASTGNTRTLGYKHLPEAKAKLSERTVSSETRAKLSALAIGRACSEETKIKLRTYAVGRVHTEETKVKMSESQRHIDPEIRARMNLENSKRGFTEEGLRRLSEAAKGRKLTLETKARMSTAAKSRSDEHRKNLSIAAKRDWGHRKQTAADAQAALDFQAKAAALTQGV